MTIVLFFAATIV